MGFFLVVVSQEGLKCLGYALKLSATVDFLQIDDHSPDIYNFVFHVVYCRFLPRIRTGRMDRMALLLTLLYSVSTIWIFSYILSFLGLPVSHPLIHNSQSFCPTSSSFFFLLFLDFLYFNPIRTLCLENSSGLPFKDAVKSKPLAKGREQDF